MGDESAAIPESSSKQGCVALSDSCVGLGYCVDTLLHSDVLLNATESVPTLQSPMDILSHMKNLLLEMSVNHTISGAKVSHQNKNPVWWIILFH